MKKLFASILALFAGAAIAATTVPPQLISPTGSTAGQAVVSNGPSSAPTWQAVPVTAVTGILPIANGGTNASTAPTALSNLGAAALAGAVFTGAITPNQTLGIVGTTTNNNANAGSVGEFVSNTATGVAASSGVTANCTSISLTAGDWEVSGMLATFPAGGTTTSFVIGGISTTSATFATLNPGPPSMGNFFLHSSAVPAGAQYNAVVPDFRVSLTATTTVYLVHQVTFAVSTMQVGCSLRARRVR